MDFLSPEARASVDALGDDQRAALALVLKSIAESLARLSDGLLRDEPWPEEPALTNPQAMVLNPDRPRRHAPWRSVLTPNQTMVVLRMLVDGEPTVTIAAQAHCAKTGVAEVASEYATQIAALKGESPEERERHFASLHRQMLHRWQAAGNSINYQPEVPVGESRLSRLAK